MNETFKHVSIFVIFLIGAIFLNILNNEVKSYFDFDFGKTTLLLIWSTSIVVMFHILYHYFKQWPEKVAYITVLVLIALIGGLSHFKIIDISGGHFNLF